MKAPRKSQSGSFVIEALISILLFAVGIVALMMIAAQGANQAGQSKYRNDASYLAGELIGDMWINAQSPTAFDMTAWNSRVANTLPGGSTSGTSVNGTTVNIVISWPDLKSSGVTHQYTTRATIAKN